MKVNFDHVALRANNPEKMKDFLIDLLGFTLGERPKFPFEGYWLYSGKKDVIHIFNDEATFYKKDLVKEDITKESMGKNIINHICFFSDSYNELMQRIKDMGISYSIGDDVRDLNIKQVFIKAPEGLVIEIQVRP